MSRVGERTLLSVTSNSTSPYTTEDSTSSETSSKVFEWAESTGATSHGKGTSMDNAASSTGFDGTDQTSTSHTQRTTNSTGRRKSSETEGPDVSTWTQSQTVQANVTQQGFEQTSDSGAVFSSTPPLTVVGHRGPGTDVTDNSSTYGEGTSHTEWQGGVVGASTSPFLSSESGRTSTSQQDGGERTVTHVLGGGVSTGVSTELSTGSTSTRKREETDSVRPLTEDGTIVLTQGLTTAPPEARGGSTVRDDILYKFHPGQQPKTEGPTEPSEVLPSTRSDSATQGPRQTERGGEGGSDTQSVPTEAPSTSAAAPTSFTPTSPTPLTTRQLEPSTTAETHTPRTTIVTTDTTQGPPPSTPSTPAQQPGSRTGGPHAHSPSGGGKTTETEGHSTDVTTLHLETSTATPGNTTAQRRPTTASYSKSSPTGPAHTTAGRTQGRTTARPEATTAQMAFTSATPIPGVSPTNTTICSCASVRA